MSRPNCPPWCVESPVDGHLRHRGETRTVAATVEARGGGGPHSTELLVELSRMNDEVAVWLYLGDGWTGFSLSLPSATRLLSAIKLTLRDAGTLEPTGP
jgi:hypothetical protein